MKLATEMQEILDHPDHQEDHGDTQGNQGKSAQESQLDTITGLGPEKRSQRTQGSNNPITNLGEKGKDQLDKSSSHKKPPKD
jgi:hypothetical protein